jgi:hypothetical protein
LISAFPYLIEYEEGEEPPIYHKPTPPKAGDMKPIDYANIVRQFASTLSKSMSMIMEAPSQTLTAAGIEGTVPKFTITKYLENSYIQVDSTKRLVGLQGVIPQDEFEQLKQYLAEQYNLSLSVSQIFSQNPEVKISVFNTLVTKFAEAAKTSAAETNTLGTPFIVYKVPRNFDDVFKCIDSIKLNWAAKNYAKRVVIEGYEPKEALLCAINILRDNPWFKFEIEIRYKNPDISGSLLVNVRGGNSLGQFVNRLDVAILKHLAPFLDTPTKVMIANTLNPTQYGDDVLDNLLAGAEDIFSQIKSSGRAFRLCIT